MVWLVLYTSVCLLQTWVNVRSEINSPTSVASLLKEAEHYSVGGVDMAEVMEAKDMCDSYMELINVTEESSAEHTTLAVILKWVL